jgi:putative ABC transport system permease protein
MKTIDTIRRAGRSLSQAKARTILTSLAIGVGAFTITLSLAAGSGGRQYATDLISANTDVHELYVTQKNDTKVTSTKPQEFQDDASVQTMGNGFVFKQLKQSDLDAISHAKGVATVEPVYTLDVMYVTRPGHKRYNASVATFKKSVSQDYLAGDASKLDDNGIVITDDYRDVLGFADAQAAIGQPIDLVVKRAATSSPTHVVISTFTKKIVGVYKSSALSFTNGTAMQITPDAAKQIYNYNTEGLPTHGSYMSAYVYADPSTNTETVKSALTDEGYQVQTAQDIMGTLFNFINVLQGILLGFGALAVLTSIFGIINTQYISVLERTQQIGLMKALGMRRRDVGRLFKFEAAWIGFLGGAIGSILATVTGLTANPYIDKALNLEKGTDLLIFEPWMLLLVIGGLMFIAVVAGILPARKAAKLDPIEALRTE